MIEKKPFVRYDDNQDKKKEDIVMLRLNEKERAMLNDAKRILQQPKDATAWKQLSKLGYYALHDTLLGKAGQYLFKNKQRNERVGIIEVE